MSLLTSLQASHAEGPNPTGMTTEKTYRLKDLALSMTPKQVEVLVEEIQVGGRLIRKITWEGKDFVVTLNHPQDETSATPAQWACVGQDEWTRLNVPQTHNDARVELATNVSRKVKIYVETLRTTCADGKKAQKRPRIEDSNIGLKIGDSRTGEHEKRLFVNPKENSFNLGTSF